MLGRRVHWPSVVAGLVMIVLVLGTFVFIAVAVGWIK
jgi:predicted anti-sigma-YlaC factor YlaD